MTKLFIGSLPFTTSEEELHSMFTAFGTVTSAKLINDRDTGRSRGFGFVEMTDDARAQEAIQKLHGSTVGTREIVVNVAKPMEPRQGREQGYGQGNGSRPARRW